MFNPFMRNLLREQQDVACAITTSTARPSIFNTINRRKPKVPPSPAPTASVRRFAVMGSSLAVARTALVMVIPRRLPRVIKTLVFERGLGLMKMGS